MMRFTEELRNAAGDKWERIITHRFTKELAAGTIDREHVLKRYLIQDYRFLDAFIVLVASVVANARCLEDRIPGCQFLAIITGSENTYFERCFETLGVTEQERNDIPNAKCTDGFCNLMREVASHGTLAEMLSVLVVCEWSYLSWAQIVLQEEQEKGLTINHDFVTYEWITLHSGTFFEGVVDYVRGLLDKEGLFLTEKGDVEALQICQKRFMQAVGLEIDFFEYAYSHEEP